MTEDSGSRLRKQIARDGTVPWVGVYDVFSASIAAQIAIEDAMKALRGNDGRLPEVQGNGESPLAWCGRHLRSNLSGTRT